MARTRGFVYVVNTAPYLDECMNSFRSLRRVLPEAPVAIVTHEEFFRDDSSVEWVPLAGTYDSPIVKWEAIRCPFDEFIFLDSDTRIIRDITGMFDVLDGFDCALAHEPSRGWDYKCKAARVFCELNTGVMVFRKSAKVEAFFDLWFSTYKKMRGEQRLLNDQPAFRDAIWLSPDIRHCTLPSEFHLITGKPNGITFDAHILHGREDLAGIEKTINRALLPRAYTPQFGTLAAFTGRKSVMQSWALFSRNAFLSFLRPSRLDGYKSPGDWEDRAGIELKSSADAQI